MLTDSIASALVPTHLVLMMLGTSVGILVGAMPGLTGAMVIALALPLTFSMEAPQALTLLVAMYVGSVSGGLITATLLRIPGTPASMMTTADGYPMAVAGKARRALTLGISASLAGGLIGWIVLLLLAAPLARISLGLGPFDFLAIVVLAMVLIASVSGESLSRGIAAGFLGMLASLPGVDPATGRPRWTMGLSSFDDGFKLLPVLIGLFAINQVAAQLLTRGSSDASVKLAQSEGIGIRIGDAGVHGFNTLRSGLIGVFIGILPGIGANIGSVIAYAFAKNASKHPEKFGSGSEEGIVASESANNATVGGALIPLIAMGIPGSVIDAVLLGALTIHGLQPGPMFMQQNPETASVIIGTMLTANLFMFAFMMCSAGWLAHLSRLPRFVITPAILCLCVVGSYALANRMFDVWVMLGFGLLGLFMERFRFPIAPFVIGLILAPIAESHLVEGLMQSGGSWLPLLTRPVSLLFLVAAVGMLTATILRHRAASISKAGATGEIVDL